MTGLRLTLMAAVFVAAAAVSGCIAEVADRGNLPTKDKLAGLHPGSTTKDQVVQILGSPSSISVFDDKSWYYISAKVKQVAFFNPDVLTQDVYIVRFDDKGVVTGIDHRGLQDGREIQPVARTTPAPGRELGFLEQLIGNLGRFNPTGGS